MKRRDLFKVAAMALGTVREGRSSADTSHQINTVLGPIPPADLGRTLIHEHVLINIVGADRMAPGQYDGGEVRSVVLPHLKRLRSQGCRTFVDCTPAYQGRDPELLARLSQASGLNILTNTGLYGATGGRYVPDFALSATAEDLAARWTSEFQAGIPPAGIRPALIKPKFLTGSDGILLIRRGIIQSSVSNYWQQGEQRIGLGLQRSRLWHLLKAWGGVFRFQPIGHACSTG